MPVSSGASSIPSVAESAPDASVITDPTASATAVLNPMYSPPVSAPPLPGIVTSVNGMTGAVTLATGGTSGGFFSEEFQVASATWNVTHNLGFNPSVMAVDTAGNWMIGDILYVNVNSLVITFSAATSGTVYCS